MAWLIPIIFLLTPLPGVQNSDSSAPEPTEAPPVLEAMLVSSRPKIRPGEWCTLAWVLEAPDGESVVIGPPDDGIMPQPGTEQTDTRLRWLTDEDGSFSLIPDLLSVQWPNTVEVEGSERGGIQLPQTIFIPVKAGPESIVGEAVIRFALEGVRLGGEPADFLIEEEVTVEVVHPTDPNATDMEGVNPMIFTTWRGELPDWSIRDTTPSKPRKPAPPAIWLVFIIPLGIVLLALTWAFATKRM